MRNLNKNEINVISGGNCIIKNNGNDYFVASIDFDASKVDTYNVIKKLEEIGLYTIKCYDDYTSKYACAYAPDLKLCSEVKKEV